MGDLTLPAETGVRGSGSDDRDRVIQTGPVPGRPSEASAVAKLGDVGANSVAAAPSVPGLPGTPYSRGGRMVE